MGLILKKKKNPILSLILIMSQTFFYLEKKS